MENVELKPGYKQVCIWPSTILGGSTPEDFEKHFEEQGFRVQYLETIETKPDIDSTGRVLIGSGGRKDIFLAIHTDDVIKFALPRLAMGIRWIEDVTAEINNYHLNPIYPERVLKYKSW